MTTSDHLQAIHDRGDPVAQWAEVKVLYPQAGHWFNEGWHYGALRRDDPVVREISLEALIDVLLDREVSGSSS